MPDPERFHGLWTRLGCRGDAAASLATLIDSYSAPGRYYHDAAHVRDCLRHFDAAASEAERPDEVGAAIWYHDADYDSRGSDNEERSADLAAKTLKGAQASTEVFERIGGLILATKHDREPATPDGRLLVDVDLAILGADAD